MGPDHSRGFPAASDLLVTRCPACLTQRPPGSGRLNDRHWFAATAEGVARPRATGSPLQGEAGQSPALRADISLVGQRRRARG